MSHCACNEFFSCVSCAAPRRQYSVARAGFTVEAAQNAVQRIRLSEKQRMYNKARKSAVATRMKKVPPSF